jgi:hypothetical protein
MVTLSPRSGLSSWSQNTSASGPGFPIPSDTRSSSCWRRCSNKSVTVLVGIAITRRPAFVLGDLKRKPDLVSSRLRQTVMIALSRSTSFQRSAAIRFHIRKMGSPARAGASKFRQTQDYLGGGVHGHITAPLRKRFSLPTERARLRAGDCSLVKQSRTANVACANG